MIYFWHAFNVFFAQILAQKHFSKLSVLVWHGQNCYSLQTKGGSLTAMFFLHGYINDWFFYIYSLVNLVVFVRVLGTCYGKETSRFCQAQNFEASFLCTAHFITSACSFNIGLALLLGIRSLDPRPRARTAPALAWCRRQLGSQTSCSAKSHSQFWSLTFNDKHWNVWWNLAS